MPGNKLLNPNALRVRLPGKEAVLHTLAVIFVAINIGLARQITISLLLYCYWHALLGVLQGMIAVILVTGLLLPGAAIGYWVWDMYHDELLKQQGGEIAVNMG